MGIYEVMRVNDKVRRLIAQKASEDIVRDAAIVKRLERLFKSDWKKS